MASTTSTSSSSMRRPAPAEPAVMIGEYRRLNEVGKGSYAIVYRSVHVQKGEIVAVKSVDLGKLNKKLKENLRSEVRILQELHHPHIVSLFDFKETSKQAHLVMEYCGLGDLSRLIKKRATCGDHEALKEAFQKYPNPTVGGLNEVVARHFLQQMASGLQWIRKRNFLHRDIKPQNLLLVPSPMWHGRDSSEFPLMVDDRTVEPPSGVASLPVLKIADFGFARFLPSLQLADTLCGSPLYMAPEILRYEKYDAKADLWSTGTVLYEMIVGKPPFRASNHVELISKIDKNNDRIRYPEGLVIGDDLKAIVAALLKKNPTERISYETFFSDDTVSKPIPNLHPDDQPPKEVESSFSSRPTIPSQDSSSSRRNSATLQDTPVRSSPRQSISSPSNKQTDKRPSIPGPSVTELPREKRPSLHGPSVTEPANTKVSSKPPSRNESPLPRADKEKTWDQATQDVLETEYIIIDTRQTQVNGLADELNNSPHVRSNSGTVARRPPLANTPYSTTAPQTSTRPWPVGKHNRTTSLEQQLYSRSPNSGSSAITKALNMAAYRMFGLGTSPPPAKSMSPPTGYNAFPSYPTVQGSGLLTIDSARGLDSKDEDYRIAALMERLASRCDVVYSFAEVKYSQLAPMKPIDMPGIPEEPEDDYLTADAIVAIAEEAIVLYVHALSILKRIFDIAGYWFNQKKRGDITTSPRSVPVRPAISVDSKINSIAQFCRSRFNECLEKSEFVGRRLSVAQKTLPLDHPGHPSNHPSASTSSVKAKVGASAENVELTTGITAEKLMYERAIEMSKAAAINELTNTELEAGVMSYRTVIHMLEAILDDGPYDESGRKVVKKDSASITGLANEDRDSVKTVLNEVRKRYNSLRDKLKEVKGHQSNRRLSGQAFNKNSGSSKHSPGGTPSPNHRGLSPK